MCATTTVAISPTFPLSLKRERESGVGVEFYSHCLSSVGAPRVCVCVCVQYVFDFCASRLSAATISTTTQLCESFVLVCLCCVIHAVCGYTSTTTHTLCPLLKIRVRFRTVNFGVRFWPKQLLFFPSTLTTRDFSFDVAM